MRNNAPCIIVRVGTIRIRMFDRTIKTLTDVRHVPELKQNLISLSAHDLKDYRFTVECGVLKVSRSTLVVMKGYKSSTQMYILHGSRVIRDAVVSTSPLTDDEITKLWHMRLGHMSENGMVELSKRELFDGQNWETEESQIY